MNKNTKKWTLLAISIIAVFALSAILWGVSVHQKKVEKERKMEARFDKFMGYYYPILADMAQVSDVYRRMQISMMYDYIKYNKPRYAGDYVSYFDGGCFSTRTLFNYMFFLKSWCILNATKSFTVIGRPSKSRRKECKACRNILQSVVKMLNVDIYDGDLIRDGKQEKVHELLDSLNYEIQSGIMTLSRYKNNSTRIDLNDIPESEYDLSNY